MQKIAEENDVKRGLGRAHPIARAGVGRAAPPGEDRLSREVISHPLLAALLKLQNADPRPTQPIDAPSKARFHLALNSQRGVSIGLHVSPKKRKTKAVRSKDGNARGRAKKYSFGKLEKLRLSSFTAYATIGLIG